MAAAATKVPSKKIKGQEQKSVSSRRAVPGQTYSDQPDLCHILTLGPLWLEENGVIVIRLVRS